jgi:hypothetical protein
MAVSVGGVEAWVLTISASSEPRLPTRRNVLTLMPFVLITESDAAAAFAWETRDVLWFPLLSGWFQWRMFI